jgi:hypothetical protein
MMVKNVLCLVLFCVGTGMIWFQEGFITYIGVFFLMWANNIGLMHNIENMKKEDKNILKILFGDDVSKEKIEKIMSQNMKVSDK